MKTRPLPTHRQGFTLVEIMTVITIIGLLAALGFGGYQVALQKAASKNTLARMAALQLGIESYKVDNGEYPETLESSATTSIKGADFPYGGAKLLYQVMTGDGDDALKGGSTASTGQLGSTGKAYWDEVTPPTAKDVEEKRKKPMVDKADDGSFFMIDGWRKPFQYVKALKDRNKRISNLEEVHSDGDYEIWSYGKQESPADDPESQKEWITSWGAH